MAEIKYGMSSTGRIDSYPWYEADIEQVTVFKWCPNCGTKQSIVLVDLEDRDKKFCPYCGGKQVQLDVDRDKFESLPIKTSKEELVAHLI